MGFEFNLFKHGHGLIVGELYVELFRPEMYIIQPALLAHDDLRGCMTHELGVYWKHGGGIILKDILEPARDDAGLYGIRIITDEGPVAGYLHP
jgi:hypothetical protein